MTPALRTILFGGQPVRPVFDGVNVYALYGLQQLKSSYGGPLVTLRRASDNAEQTFYPVKGKLKRADVLSWAGAGVAVYVKTWFDQSGNGYDAIQTTSIRQPYLDFSAADPALYFLASGLHRLPLPSAALTFGRNQAALSSAAVASGDGTIAGTSYEVVVVPAGSVDATFSLRSQNGSPNKWTVFARRVNGAGFGLPTSAVNSDDSGWKSLVGEADFANNVSAVSVDGVRTTATTNTAGNTEDANPYGVPHIGSSPTGGNPFQGFMRAAVLVRSSLSTGDRALVNAALDYLKPSTTNGNIAAWGDSLTAPSGYPDLMPSMFDGYRHAYNGGVGGESAAQIRARQVADLSYNQRINLLWAGRNGFKTLTPAQIIADIDLMIAHVVGGRWLVFGILPSTLDSAGDIATLNTFNAALATAYGSRYVDMKAAMQAAGDGSANDIADVAADYTPRSLRSDELHPNAAGKAVIASRARAAIMSFGW